MAEFLCYPPAAMTTLLIGYGAQLLICVQFFAAPWTVTLLVPLSMEFSRQEYWSGFPFPSPGDLPNPGIKSILPALASEFFATSAT